MGVVMAGAAAFVHVRHGVFVSAAAGSSSARSPARCWRWPRRARAGSASRTWCGRGAAAPRAAIPPPAPVPAPATRRAIPPPGLPVTPLIRLASRAGGGRHPRSSSSRSGSGPVHRPPAPVRHSDHASRRELGQWSERGHADGVGFRRLIHGGSSREPSTARRRRATSRSCSPGCCSARSCSRTATRSYDRRPRPHDAGLRVDEHPGGDLLGRLRDRRRGRRRRPGGRSAR